MSVRVPSQDSSTRSVSSPSPGDSGRGETKDLSGDVDEGSDKSLDDVRGFSVVAVLPSSGRSEKQEDGSDLTISKSYVGWQRRALC